ncbi:MAG: phosphatase PAP2 family protein [Cyclobacteriaceae bacterium]
MEDILALDQKIFLEMNSYHNPWLDQIMMFLSSTTGWIPLYLILFYLLLKNYRKQTWLVLLAITLTVFFADQITSSVMKPFFARLRPSHEPSLQGLVYLVNDYRGGSYGFASSHAANTFGIATLMWLLLKNYRPWTALLFLWAGFVGYTRIYLGVHYPGDIVAGQCVGLMCALATYSGFTRAKNYLDDRTLLRSG